MPMSRGIYGALNGELVLTGSKLGFLENGERLSVPNRLVVMAVGSGSPRQAGQSG